MSDLNLLSSYDYFLPPELIASEPIIPKEEANLLIYYKSSKKIEHAKFKNLHEILPDCAVVFNDTKVIKARLLGVKSSGGKAEVMLNQPLGEGKFSAYIKGRVSNKSIINFKDNIKAHVINLNNDGTRIVKFSKNEIFLDTNDILKEIENIGHIPLPPYIKRVDREEDENWYQSIFATYPGAVAAPTASLHFSENLIKKIQNKHRIEFITLHVGAGTFKGVECKYINDHKIHSEFYQIPQKTAELIDSNIPILGIGTTVTRCIEFYAKNKRSSGFCDLFLNPNNKPIRQNHLLTNFHLPKSTLIMLVASFIGLEETHRIYKTAIERRYRFYSYGDGMIII